MAEKKFNPYKYRPKQKGRGWNFKRSYRIPVRPHSEIDLQPMVPLVTPIAAVEERMKDEYQKDVQEGHPHVAPDKGIKRKATAKTFISNKIRKGSTTLKVNGKKFGRKTVKDSQRGKLGEKKIQEPQRNTRKGKKYIQILALISIGAYSNRNKMSFLSSDSTEIDQPMELSIFAEPSNQVAVEKIFFTEYRPISSIESEDTPIEIVVSGSGAEYIDLRRSRLYVKAKIVKADGTDLADDENAGVVNLPLQSMFSQMDVYLNNKLVSFNTNNYPWKAYMKTMLFSGRDELMSQKQAELFFKDSGNLSDAKSAGGGNSGLVMRYYFTKKSRIFELEGNLMEDVFDLDKYLINGVDTYIKLFRSSAPFIFMSTESTPSYKLKLLDVVYKVAKVRVDPGVLLQHSKQLETAPVKYPLTRNEVKMNTIAKGSTEFYWENMFPQAIPERVVIGMVKQKAVNGDYTLNPFNFEHFNITAISLSVNGESVPGRPLQMDFGDNRNYISAYVRLFESCGKWNKDAGLYITREDFGNGYTLFAFNITPWFFEEDYLNLVRRGNTRLELKFNTSTTEAVNVVVLATFSSLLEINKSRDINYVQP